MFSGRRISRDEGQQYLRNLVRLFLIHLVSALAGDIEAIHQLRVYGRRLRVALPLLAVKPAGKRVRRARRLLRGVIRAAGASRDRDVSLELLETGLTGHPQITREGRALRARLRNSARLARKRLPRQLLGTDIYRLRTALRVMLGRCVPREEALARITPLCNAEREILHAELPEQGQRFEPVKLHGLRRRLRRLRYAAEFQDQMMDRKTGAAAMFRRMQTQLGQMHDHWVLAQWLQAQGESSMQRGQPQLALAARRLRLHVLKSAHERHREWLEENPAQQLESALWPMTAVVPHMQAAEEAGDDTTLHQSGHG
ncbi:MAG: CHAD domain-containing protein [Nevskiales bacterium]